LSIIRKRNLKFDTETQTGVIFHLMGACNEFGKLGVTCIGNSVDEANDLYEYAVATLNEECAMPVEN
jgi:hypothetical protein